MKEFVSALIEDEAEDSEEEEFIEFKLDGRTLKAYTPTPGQLTFMMAAMGRGQTQESRMAGVVNVMLGCFRGGDQDYLESRLLDPNPKTRLEPNKIEEIFEFLTEEWFGRPTQPQSDSAESSVPDTQKSKATTTKSKSSGKAQGE